MAQWKTRHAAEHLGVSRRRVAQLIAAGLIVAEKDGRDWDVDEASVREYANTMQVRMPKAEPKASQ